MKWHGSIHKTLLLHLSILFYNLYRSVKAKTDDEFVSEFLQRHRDFISKLSKEPTHSSTVFDTLNEINKIKQKLFEENMPHIWPKCTINSEVISKYMYLKNIATAHLNTDHIILMKLILQPIELGMVKIPKFVTCITKKLYECHSEFVPLDYDSFTYIMVLIKNDCYSLQQSGNYFPPLL